MSKAGSTSDSPLLELWASRCCIIGVNFKLGVQKKSPPDDYYSTMASLKIKGRNHTAGRSWCGLLKLKKRHRVDFGRGVLAVLGCEVKRD